MKRLAAPLALLFGTLALVILGAQSVRDWEAEPSSAPGGDSSGMATSETSTEARPEDDIDVAGTTTTRPLSETDPSTYFVSSTGDDTHDGQAPETATLDLQAAINRLQPGQTLFVMNGTYERVLGSGQGGHFRLASSGEPNKPITIAAAPGHQPVILATQGSGIELVGSYLTLRGITIRGEGFGPDNDFGFGVMAEKGHHIEISEMTVSGMPIGGIATIETSHVTITDNTVFDNAKWGPEQGSGISIYEPIDFGHGPDADGYTDRIMGNLVYGNENVTGASWRDDGMVTDGNGIILDYGRRNGYSGSFLVANNIVSGNGGRGVHIFNTDRVDVIHNSTFGNGRSTNLFPEGSNAELAAYDAAEVRFLDNIAQASEDSRLTLRTWRADDHITDNNVYVGDEPDGGVGPNDVVLANGPIYKSPTLDARAGNFAVLPQSPASGLAASRIVSVDAFGTRRSEAPTAGAVELAAQAGRAMPAETLDTSLPGDGGAAAAESATAMLPDAAEQANTPAATSTTTPETLGTQSMTDDDDREAAAAESTATTLPDPADQVSTPSAAPTTPAPTDNAVPPAQEPTAAHTAVSPTDAESTDLGSGDLAGEGSEAVDGGPSAPNLADVEPAPARLPLSVAPPPDRGPTSVDDPTPALAFIQIHADGATDDGPQRLVTATAGMLALVVAVLGFRTLAGPPRSRSVA